MDGTATATSDDATAWGACASCGAVAGAHTVLAEVGITQQEIIDLALTTVREGRGPALVVGGWLGFRLFHRVSDDGFRRVILLLFLISGLSLIF